MNTRLQLLFLSLFLILTSLAVPAAIPAGAQTCGVSTDSVEVRLRSAPSSISDTTRREHLRVSQGLLDALCISNSNIASNGDDSPQVRVVITSDSNTNAPSSLPSSGLFTLTSVDTGSSAKWIEIYGIDPLDSGDKNNGLVKLFPYTRTSSFDVDNASARVYSVAPHATVQVTYSLWWGTSIGTVDTHYANPTGEVGQQFEEYVQIESEKDMVLLVPHGGAIETEVSDVIPRLLNSAGSYNLDPSVWEARGHWGSGQTHRRWHITAGDVHAPSFPGLQDLLDEPDYDTGQPFRWALALHGYTGRVLTLDPATPSLQNDTSGAFYGIIIGGQAHADTKCYLALAIRDRLLSRRNDVAITVYYGSSSNPSKYEVPGLGGVIKTGGFTGLASSNIVNRLAPGGSLQHGGIQVELSQSLRNDATWSDPHIADDAEELLRRTANGLGRGMGQLNGYADGAQGACAELQAVINSL